MFYLINNNETHFIPGQYDWREHVRRQFIDAYILCAFMKKFFVGWNSATGRVLVSWKWTPFTPYKMTGFDRDFFSSHSEEESYDKVYIEALYQGIKTAKMVLEKIKKDPRFLSDEFDEFFAGGKIKRHYVPLVISPRPLGPEKPKVVVRRKLPLEVSLSNKLKLYLACKYQKELRAKNFLVATFKDGTLKTNIGSILHDVGHDTIVVQWTEVDRWLLDNDQRNYADYKKYVEDFWTWLVQNYKI